MQVPLIRKKIESFKSKMAAANNQEFILKWECLQNFEKNWDLTSNDFLEMYSNSFRSKISQRLWVQDQYAPKAIMQEFIRIDKHFVRSMFRDLLNEEKDLMMRISRFVFHCDSLLKILQDKDRRYSSHDHQNYKMISIYLSFQYPARYTIYDYNAYKRYMKNIAANKVPMENELPKFFLLMKSLLTNFIAKDKELMKRYEEILIAEGLPHKTNMLMSHDIYTHP